jgi:cysteine desulfurase / selenocysteine lyase
VIQAATISNRLDVYQLRQQFPLLGRHVKGQPLIYLDNAATSQKPQVVIDALVNYYGSYNANIHRGIHSLAEEATMAFESTRDTVQAFIHAGHREEILFTSGTTEGINLVAYTWGRQNLGAGDEIIISTMEHHSNIVPWQILCEEKKAILHIIPVTDQGELSMDAYQKLLSRRTKLVSVVHVSNVLGTINPVKKIIALAHQVGAKALIDGAQSVVHLDIDVRDLDCDFFVFSSHKIYGPTGVGVLYGKKQLLETMPVFKGGGEMIKEVTFERTSYNDLPYKYEAGTPNIADTIALKSALDFVTSIGQGRIRAHEEELLALATTELERLPGLSIIGTAREKTGVISFVIGKLHPQDIGILLDNRGIAVRTGHHCAEPLMRRFAIPGTTRVSFGMYNTTEEIEILIHSLAKTIKILS